MDPSDLYGLPLERFTPERNALAKALRGEGRRDEAQRVSKLRKPSVAAWAVNQLVRTQRRELEALFEAGDALRTAQADLLAKRGHPQRLRDAAQAERTAVDELARRARGLLSSDGHELTPARFEQVTETLHAAAHDPDARARVKDGCLERELRHIGLGALGAGAGAPRRHTRRPQADQPQAKLSAARKDEVAARRHLERSERELEAARRRHRVAEAELAAAEDALAHARETAQSAEREHRRAEQALARLVR